MAACTCLPSSSSRHVSAAAAAALAAATAASLPSSSSRHVSRREEGREEADAYEAVCGWAPPERALRWGLWHNSSFLLPPATRQRKEGGRNKRGRVTRTTASAAGVSLQRRACLRRTALLPTSAFHPCHPGALRRGSGRLPSVRVPRNFQPWQRELDDVATATCISSLAGGCARRRKTREL